MEGLEQDATVLQNRMETDFIWIESMQVADIKEKIIAFVKLRAEASKAAAGGIFYDTSCKELRLRSISCLIFHPHLLHRNMGKFCQWIRFFWGRQFYHGFLGGFPVSWETLKSSFCGRNIYTPTFTV